MKLSLAEIEGIEPRHETIWKIRALVVEDRDPVRTALAQWSKSHSSDYKAILKVMRFCGQQHHVLNQKHVKKSTVPEHGEVYEMIAFTGIARVIFFYAEEDEAIIVCTNVYEKSRGDQNAAFRRCASFRNLYLNQNAAPKTKRTR